MEGRKSKVECRSKVKGKNSTSPILASATKRLKTLIQPSWNDLSLYCPSRRNSLYNYSYSKPSIGYGYLNYFRPKTARFNSISHNPRKYVTRWTVNQCARNSLLSLLETATLCFMRVEVDIQSRGEPGTSGTIMLILVEDLFLEERDLRWMQ